MRVGTHLVKFVKILYTDHSQRSYLKIHFWLKTEIISSFLAICNVMSVKSPPLLEFTAFFAPNSVRIAVVLLWSVRETSAQRMIT